VRQDVTPINFDIIIHKIGVIKKRLHQISGGLPSTSRYRGSGSKPKQSI
jgi:hypothetical protein